MNRKVTDSFEHFGFQLGQGRYHEDVIYSIALAFNLLNNEMTAYLKDFYLTPAQFNVLLVIRHQGGTEGISQVEISKRLIVTPSNMTRLLDKMERQKLVQREGLPDDRRVKIIKITDKAGKLLDAVWPGYQKKLAGLAQGLDAGERKTVSEKLIKLVRTLTG